MKKGLQQLLLWQRTVHTVALHVQHFSCSIVRYRAVRHFFHLGAPNHILEDDRCPSLSSGGKGLLR